MSNLPKSATAKTATAQSVLETIYGYKQFRGQQQAIIDCIINGENALVLMPTGGGKSLCYQIPSLLRAGIGIVVSPLIALMQDQVAALDQLGVSAVFLNSTQSDEQQREVISRIQAGDIDLLYIAPERLIQQQTLQWIKNCEVAMVAIDEAHCVSQWGHDFRTDYLALHQLEQYFPGVPRLALTATATPRSQEDIVQRLALRSPHIFIDSFDRPNIHYRVTAKTDAKKQLANFLAHHRDEAGIIYCLSRKKVETTVDWLNARGITALAYHAGMNAADRESNQTRFLREDGIVMVATIAFGMGIDKPDVRFVVHTNLPKSMEAYYQETGRAGRDGEPAQAFMLYGLDDVVQLTQFIDQSSASEEHKRVERSKLDTLLGWCEVTQCRRQPLLAYFGENHLTEPSATENSENKINQHNCANCDNCCSPPSTWDATEAAQKFLSCVYRTGQRFGVVHTIDVLRGTENEKIKQFQHQNLSVFGIGADLSKNQWRSLARQLVVRGYLEVNSAAYNALMLTTASRDLLKGNIRLNVRHEAAERNERKPAVRKQKGNVSSSDAKLWEQLRECRKRLAEEFDIPPYMVFHDATLMEMMELRPASGAELLSLNGVGESKLEKFGQPFLAVINGDEEFADNAQFVVT